MAAAAISQMLCLVTITCRPRIFNVKRRERDMQTGIIDLRTDKALAACLRVHRPVSVLAYDYASGDRVPAHEHAKAQLIYAIEGDNDCSYTGGTVGSASYPCRLGAGAYPAFHPNAERTAHANSILR